MDLNNYLYSFWSLTVAVLLAFVLGVAFGYYANSRTITYEMNYDINQDGKLDIGDWSAFGTKLWEQPDYVE